MFTLHAYRQQRVCHMLAELMPATAGEMATKPESSQARNAKFVMMPAEIFNKWRALCDGLK